MRKAILVIICLLLAGGAYASDISLEPLMNRVFDSTGNTIRATISGVATLTALTTDTIVTNHISADGGVLTMGGVGGTNNENMTLDFETTSNVVAIDTTTGVTSFNFKKTGDISGDVTVGGVQERITGTTYGEFIDFNDAGDGVIVFGDIVTISTDVVNTRFISADDVYLDRVSADIVSVDTILVIPYNAVSPDDSVVAPAGSLRYDTNTNTLWINVDGIQGWDGIVFDQ